MTSLLECFQQIAPYLNDLTINDTAVYVTDRERYLTVLNGQTFRLSVGVGDLVPEGTVVGECMKSGRNVRRKVPAEVLGFPYIACGIPIREGDRVVGGVSFVTSIAQEDKVLALASDLSKGLNEVSCSSQNIQEGAENLVGIYEELSTLSEGLNGYILETDSVLRVIENFARQTNLLGLNASVEAARVGSAGKGFSVIANEIRRLGVSTSDSTKKIGDIFGRIKDASKNQAGVIGDINQIVAAQSQAIKSVHELIQVMHTTVEALVSDSQKLNSGNT